MNVEAVADLVDREVYQQTNKHLNDLQQAVIVSVWQGRKYWEIADEYGCTEGHAKDIGSTLWQLLSEAWGTKVTKSNFRSLVGRKFKSSNFPTVARQVEVEKIDFIGREKAIAQLQDLARGTKVIVLQGKGGVGKTTLAQQFLARQNFDLVLEVLMAKETANIVSVASVVEEWLQRDLHEDSGKEFGVTLARFKRCLTRQRVGILIDNLEPALDRNGRLIAPHRDYIELLRILAVPQVQSLTLITSRDRLCEAEIDLEHYRLSGLDAAAWQRYFTAHDLQGIESVSQIHRIYGGNAKAMGMICGIVGEDHAGDLQQYWQENQHDPLVETDLKNLVVSQFNRLQEQDSQAYLLLCRLGCYRYQDVAKIPQAGVSCLLWDAPQRQKRVIRSLRNRSLLEFSQGEYWLHPIVQTEARSRLSPAELTQTHRQIAEFFITSVERIASIQDGLTALEAYYHLREIQDYAEAAKVILYSRENQWGQYLTLGTTLYRLGIIEPLSQAINSIIDRVTHDRHRSELNNILGDLYWTTGQVHRAIALQQQTITTSRYSQQSIPRTVENRHDLYYWRMLEVDSLLSMGLYNLDLWELDSAAQLFQQVIDLAHNTKHNSWSEKASLGLALVNSERQVKYNAPIVSQLYRLIIELEDSTYNTGRFAYFMQLLGQIFFNYRQLELASKIWYRAIAFSQSSHYTQVKAKSLMGLGKIQRLHHNFESAYTYHQQAIALLEKIAAKCDLAEAYLQQGITLQVSQSSAEAKEYFEKAIAIYQTIPAPKQVARAEGVASSE